MKPMSASHEGSSKEARKRVYIVDDHAILREGVSALINGSSDLVMCGGCRNAEEAFDGIHGASPDIVLVDLSLEGTSGLDLIKSLHARRPELLVLVLSMHDESFFAERCLRSGANGYIMKHQAIGELEKAIRRILEGGIYVSQNMSDRLLKAIARTDGGSGGSSMDHLSDREVEVFEMIGRGYGNTEIARRLHLSVKTIESYRARIKEKLDLKNSGQLLQQALAWVQGAQRPPK